MAAQIPFDVDASMRLLAATPEVLRCQLQHLDEQWIRNDYVEAMYRRVEHNRPIRRRDPLFREIFRHADKIQMRLERTPKEVRVVETSEDDYVAKLIKAHAEVVSGFVTDGFSEAHKTHAIP